MRKGISRPGTWFLLIGGLILSLLIPSCHAWCGGHVVSAAGAQAAQSTPPRVIRGHLDVSGFDFAEGTLALDGEWEFYFGQLLQPDDFRAGAGTGQPQAPSGYAPVPGSWQTAETEDGPPPRHGVATYRLLLTGLPPEATAAWALEIPYARTAYRLWANGEAIAANGTVSFDADAIRPQYRPVLVHLPTARAAAEPATFEPVGPEAFTTLELVMQVANVDFRAGGIPKSLRLGPAERVVREREMRVMSQMLLVGALGLMALFYGLMYIWRPVELAVLYFALLSGSVALRSFVTGELPITTVFPDISWHWLLRIEYVTSFAAPMFFILFLHTLFPRDVIRSVKRFSVGIGVAGMTAALFLPVLHTSYLIPYNSIVMTVLFPYVGYVLLRAAWKKRETSQFTLIGGLIFLAVMGLTLFHYNRSWTDLELVPFAIFVLFVSQALALTRRYALAFRRSTALARENGMLLAETRRQLSERQRLHRLLTEQDEQTRREIAELLHGRIQAHLFAASKGAAEAAATSLRDPEEAANMMRSVESMLEQVRTEEIRDASHRLHPEAIRAGLIGSLDALCARWEDHFDLDFSVDPHLEALDDPAEGGLSERLRLGLYRIAEEALNNIYRHAHAKRVHISIGLRTPSPSTATRPTSFDSNPSTPSDATDLTAQVTSIVLTITDDGLGFDPEAVQAGLGLQLIAARTADLSGDFNFTSASGQGATLRVAVPLP